jgi:hypothetical protein
MPSEVLPPEHLNRADERCKRCHYQKMVTVRLDIPVKATCVSLTQTRGLQFQKMATARLAGVLKEIIVLPIALTRKM